MFSIYKRLTAFLHAYKIEIILASCWVVVEASLFYRYGIVTELEAAKYIAEADNLIAKGTVSSPNFWLYSTQIFLITAAKQLNAGYIPVAMVQWLFNGLATWYFYKFAARISNKITGVITALLLVFNIPLQTFNFFLQTESLFCSFTLLFSCYLLSLEKLTLKNFMAVFLFLLLICFTRPTGLLWVPCTFLYLFFRFFRPLSVLVKTIITGIASIGFLFFLNAALGSGGELDFMLPFRDERIICGVPTLSHFIEIKTSRNPNSVFGILYYITHNSGQFLRLAWLRSRAFFGLFRTYYSTGHNIYLGLCFYPLYFFSLLSIRQWMRQNKHLLLFCSSLVMLTWVSVILTCDDWHNRFFLSVVPYIYILAIPFIKHFTDKRGNNASK
ncbi:MAG: hypothetical protein Q8941_10875 [Bacteroidota bacterium]|nr:hypothetical protein [Bacteroidota bacterium]